MKKINFLLASLLTASFCVTSCDKDDIAEKSDTTSIQASATINAANEIDLNTGLETIQEPEIIVESAEIRYKLSQAVPSYPQVNQTSSGNSYPKTFTINYGPTGSTSNSITRKGSIEITITGPIGTTGSILTIERMDDYYINGNKFEGTIEYVNITATTGVDANVPKWTRTVENGIFTNANGKVFTNSGTYTIKQTAGADTYVLSDNTYEMISGNHITTNEAGNSLTLTVKETLVKNYSCQYVSEGKLNIVGGVLDGVIDYGNGDCDNNYSYTHKNGIVYNLNM